MSWNGSGTFTRTNGTYSGSTVWAQDNANGFDIEPERQDSHDQDLAAGINACLAKNGENAMTGDLNLGTNDITNGGAATFSSAVTAGSYVGLPVSSATVSGIVELATDAETQTGTDATRAVTPAGLQACTATETRKGVVELATTAEAVTGTDTAMAVTPAGVAAALAAGGAGDDLSTKTQVWSGSATSVASSSLSGTTAGLYLVEYDQSGAGSLWYGTVYIPTFSLGSGRRYTGSCNAHPSLRVSHVFYLGSGSAGIFFANDFETTGGTESSYNIKTIWRVG